MINFEFHVNIEKNMQHYMNLYYSFSLNGVETHLSKSNYFIYHTRIDDCNKNVDIRFNAHYAFLG
jgi:hypothetical protein